MYDEDEPPRSAWGWVSGGLQVAMLLACLLAAIFGVYHLFQARVHHRFW